MAFAKRESAKTVKEKVISTCGRGHYVIQIMHAHPSSGHGGVLIVELM